MCDNQLSPLLASHAQTSAKFFRESARQYQRMGDSTTEAPATSTLAHPTPTATRTPRPTATPVPTPPPANPSTIEALSVFGVLIAAVIILGLWLNRHKVF